MKQEILDYVFGRQSREQKKYFYNYRKSEHGKDVLRIHRQKRRALKMSSVIQDINYQWINERDGYKCQICGKKIDMTLSHRHPLSKSYDHILPLSKGGDHSSKNIQLAHFGCNSRKKNNVINGVQQCLF
jgi:5-methylcytosine-specific restriction endonuclease McrA